MPATTTEKVAAAERRRTNKPIMEKKRRQRINDSLNHLKNLVLEGLKKDPSRYSKLEKADILEMTVRHVQSLQRQENIPPMRAPSVDPAAKYRAGFGQCAAEVTKFLEGDNTLNSVQRSRILVHLSDVMTGLHNPTDRTSGPADAPVQPQQQQANSRVDHSLSQLFTGTQHQNFDSLLVRGAPYVPAQVLTGPMGFVLPPGVSPGELNRAEEFHATSEEFHHHVPPTPPHSSASVSPSPSSCCSPSPCRSPSPQPLDLAPVRHSNSNPPPPPPVHPVSHPFSHRLSPSLYYPPHAMYPSHSVSPPLPHSHSVSPLHHSHSPPPSRHPPHHHHSSIPSHSRYPPPAHSLLPPPPAGHSHSPPHPQDDDNCWRPWRNHLQQY